MRINSVKNVLNEVVRSVNNGTGGFLQSNLVTSLANSFDKINRTSSMNRPRSEKGEGVIPTCGLE